MSNIALEADAAWLCKLLRELNVIDMLDKVPDKAIALENAIVSVEADLKLVEETRDASQD